MKAKENMICTGRKNYIKMSSFLSEENGSYFKRCVSFYNDRSWNITVIYNHKVRFPSLCDMKNVPSQDFTRKQNCFLQLTLNARYQSCDGFYYSEFSFVFLTGCLQSAWSTIVYHPYYIPIWIAGPFFLLKMVL